MTVWSGAGMCPAFDAAFTMAAGPDGIRDRVPFSFPCSRHSPLGARVVPVSVFDRLSSDHQHLANSVATFLPLHGPLSLSFVLPIMPHRCGRLRPSSSLPR